VETNKPQIIDAEKFIALGKDKIVLDVRSPKEYAEGHIPNAVSFPLFDDNERAVVGTLYKNDGKFDAIIKALEFVGPKMVNIVKCAKEMTNGKNELLLYCWRGGMRSNSVAWLLQTAGFRVSILEGGYKSYRNFILTEISRQRKYIVLGGMTGSGKTAYLQQLKEKKQQVIDLEALACHKGSAFGQISDLVQPTTEYFLNLLYEQISLFDENKIIWMEDESRSIGRVNLPEIFYKNFRESPLIVMHVSLEKRVENLVSEYTVNDKNFLIECFKKIERKLGGQHLKSALQAIDESDFHKAAAIALYYYDKAYQMGLKFKDTEKVYNFTPVSDNIDINVSELLQFSNNIINTEWKTTA
jgi:tRNA 2-selenouridine synthase